MNQQGTRQMEEKVDESRARREKGTEFNENNYFPSSSVFVDRLLNIAF